MPTDPDRPPPQAPSGWTLVLPVKGGRRAKSRLGAGPALALAIAQDTVAAVLACPSVAVTVVVTADEQVRSALTGSGARVVGQPEAEPGLAGAVRTGLRTAAGPVAVLLADVPALRPQDLGTALAGAWDALAGGAAMAAVPDADGIGTVLLAGARAADLTPSFGPGSLARHRSLGAAVLDLDLPRLRRDVDTAPDLDSAAGLGVGPHTRAALDAARRVGPCRPPCTVSTP